VKIVSCIDPIGKDEEFYFFNTRLQMVQDDINKWKERFKKYESYDGRVDGYLYDKDGLFSSLQDFARHIRQMEWLLNELQDKRKQSTEKAHTLP
jgi:cell division protein ZapA (FtsZ GTPase activity inhibitor)